MTELKSRAGNIEYRVREVKRYIVTRYGIGMAKGGFLQSSQHGEFDNFETAYAVGYALCRAEQERLGWPLDDERISYPQPDSPDYPLELDGPVENGSLDHLSLMREK